jgi:hypothetical protein
MASISKNFLFADERNGQAEIFRSAAVSARCAKPQCNGRVLGCSCRPQRERKISTMQILRTLCRPFGVSNSQTILGGTILVFIVFGEAAFAYGSILI